MKWIVIHTPCYPAEWKVIRDDLPEGHDNSTCNYFRSETAAYEEAAKRNGTTSTKTTPVCVLCGRPWIPAVKNRCECGGICSWGVAKGAEPESWQKVSGGHVPRPVPKTPKANGILQLEDLNMNGLVTLTKLPKCLRISLTPAGREELMDKRNADGTWKAGTDSILADLLEDHLANGWELPEDIGALTSAPILSDSAQRDDQGKLTKIGDCYWFPDYAVTSELEEMLDKGFVNFALAPSE